MSKDYFDKLFVESCGESKPFNDDVTYKQGAEFIGELSVEDWGCGLGWYRRFAKGAYKGIDGSWSPYADEVVDLCHYTSDTQAIFMRNVLEYNPNTWNQILDNALLSFTDRMVLVMTNYQVPAPVQVARCLKDVDWQSHTSFGRHAVWYLERT